MSQDVDGNIIGLEGLAARWLAAEGCAADEPHRPQLGEDAVRAGLAFEAALARASLEDKRLAWEAARVVQAGHEMGSRAWAAARRVSELLRAEYGASREA